MNKGDKCLQIPPRILKEPHAAYAQRPTESFEFSKGRSLSEADLICLSHLRWDFVYQRPQHLLSRCAQERRVFFVEEPLFDREQVHLEINCRPQGVWVVVPHLPRGVSEEEANLLQAGMIDELLVRHAITRYVLWAY